MLTYARKAGADRCNLEIRGTGADLSLNRVLEWGPLIRDDLSLNRCGQVQSRDPWHGRTSTLLHAGTQFTCFTDTKVHILTQRHAQMLSLAASFFSDFFGNFFFG
jgi:hypothetical protein